MNKKTIVILIVVLLVSFFAFTYYKRNSEKVQKEAQKVEMQKPEAQNSIGSSIYKGINTENPTKKMPKSNPFEAPTNPISNSYENPF